MLVLTRFREALAAPDRSLRTFGPAQPECDADGLPAVSRTALFAEAVVRCGGERWLLSAPLARSSLARIERALPRMRAERLPFVGGVRLLRDEMRCTDSAGAPRTVDLLAERLPEGRTLEACFGHCDPERIGDALDRLQRSMRALRFTHNNLKARNLLLGTDDNLYLVRSYYAAWNAPTEADDDAFEALRRRCGRHSVQTALLRDTEAPYRTPLTPYPGHLHVGPMCEQLLCVEDRTGYGYVDPHNRPAIASRFLWADDFREGRAVVATHEGTGLIDKQGRFVIEPRYEAIDYDERDGISVVYRDGFCARFGYDGRQLGPFRPEGESDGDEQTNNP